MLNRRELLKWTGLTFLAGRSASGLESMLSQTDQGPDKTLRCINVVNFIRGVEPRFKTDLLLPVQRQMESILLHNLPATWLLQYDALVAEEFVPYLKEHMTKSHEVGFWFEMNQKLCEVANVEWRGRPGYEWDHLPPVAFTIGYTPDERIRLADAAMAGFKQVWGKYPASIASWNLDSITIAHLVDKYAVDAFAVCRDQIATDGFTIWGAPIAGYYPSKTNCWSPALSKRDQIEAPVLRMLGQDPVHYYDLRYRLPDGRTTTEPDTMEPVWSAGQSDHFVAEFLQMIASGPSLKFAYAQLGQENSFPWDQMKEAYPKQMAALAKFRGTGALHVETMGETGRRFKRAFKTTPSQTQVMLTDSLGDSDPAESSIWYQSQNYRANLHFRGDLPYFRDITRYSDEFPQPYLKKATRENDVEQRMPAILDGFHWSGSHDSIDGADANGDVGAGGFLLVDGKRFQVVGLPQIVEHGDSMNVSMKGVGGESVSVNFSPSSITIRMGGHDKGKLELSFDWDPAKSALRQVTAKSASYSWQGFDYQVTITKGEAVQTESGWAVIASDSQMTLSFK